MRIKTGLRQKYRIVLRNREIESIESEGHKINNFEQPATKNKLPKLYVVKSGAKVIYIGIASRNMRSRLRYGFQAKGKGGYHGYKWKDLSEVDILIWYFPKEKMDRIKALEAELVYLVRKNSGEWPSYQTEIHFRNTTDDEVRAAEEIFRAINSA